MKIVVMGMTPFLRKGSPTLLHLGWRRRGPVTRRRRKEEGVVEEEEPGEELVLLWFLVLNIL